MSRTRSVLATLGLLAAAAGADAQQPPGPTPYAPNTSPYFNLLRGGSPTFNYYGLVRPQQQAQAAYQGFQQQFNAMGQQFNRLSRQVAEEQEGGTSAIRPTGQSATYRNYSHYYPRLTQGPAGRR